MSDGRSKTLREIGLQLLKEIANERKDSEEGMLYFYLNEKVQSCACFLGIYRSKMSPILVVSCDRLK